ncbi:diphthamide synthesis protein [Candidatus Woesearchaeota archaeon]|nr:diphthamide synthesis protein [Candidatus Woesearchaeota archaeon]
MHYNLELDNAVAKIKQENSKIVCIQLPDGLKPKAGEIADYLYEQTGATIIIWLGSCYGACDVPTQVQNLGTDLLIQWGHTEWK